MHVRTLLATTAVLVLALTGCGSDDPEPKIQPTETVEPTETESPTPETPEEFFDRWFVEETKMITTGETEDYMAMSVDCAPCTTVAKRIQRIYSRGGQANTAGVKPTKVSRVSPRTYRVHITSAPTRYTERAGGPVKRMPGGRGLLEFTVVADTDYRVTDYIQVSQ